MSGVVVTLESGSVQFIDGANRISDGLSGLILYRDDSRVAVFGHQKWVSAVMVADFPGSVIQDSTGIWKLTTPGGESNGIPEPDPQP